MLYEKCKDMLTVDISMNEEQLITIRNVLSLADASCKQLSLLDVERLWCQHEEWHGRQITVDKNQIKHFIMWLARNLVSTTEMKNIYANIDALFEQ